VTKFYWKIKWPRPQKVPKWWKSAQSGHPVWRFLFVFYSDISSTFKGLQLFWLKMLLCVGFIFGYFNVLIMAKPMANM